MEAAFSQRFRASNPLKFSQFSTIRVGETISGGRAGEASSSRTPKYVPNSASSSRSVNNFPQRGWHSAKQIQMNDNVSEHRFGSFSLGDVFDQEIQKKGQFAFRGRQSNVQSSTRFIDLFAKSFNTEVETRGMCLMNRGVVLAWKKRKRA